MRDIQMVDLLSQYEKIKEEIDTNIINVVRSSQYIKGPEVQKFEAELAEYLGIKHVIGCANGTDALQLAMMALDFKPGDEVITPTFTYVSTVEVVALLGLKPVLVDVDPKTFNIDPEKVEEAITDRTVAIVPVHLFGQCADMANIVEIAVKNNLYILEDTAQAIGSAYLWDDHTKKAGTIGDIGTTSFFPSKNLGCMGDGGALFTHDDELAEKIRMLANHGQSKLYHFDLVGVNSRLDSMQAAILRTKLRHLDAYCEARQNAAAYYDRAFENNQLISTPFRDTKSSHVYHQYTLILDEKVDRNGLGEHLKSKKIPYGVYYPLPMHRHGAYKDDGYKEEDFPVSERLCKSVISLPMHTELSEEQLSFITNEVLKYLS